MKIKIFSQVTAEGLDKKVNNFLQVDTMEPIEVTDIMFSLGSMYAAMIIYK